MAKEEKKGTKHSWWIAVVVIVFLILFLSSMVQVTVIDPNSLQNLTININIT